MELSFIIVDDTELDHFIAKKMIGNAYRLATVESFYDGTEAIEHIKKNKPPTGIKVILILLDIYMPVMTGFQFVEEFEKLDPDVQKDYYIVALTSSREISDINRINSHNAFKGMINKPISTDELTSLLSNISKELGVKLR